MTSKSITRHNAACKGPTSNCTEHAKAIEWVGPHLKLLDQRLLPKEEHYLLIADVESTYDAIHQMVVRGAPAIGIVAAYGVVFSARAHAQSTAVMDNNIKDELSWRQKIIKDINYLRQSRPTAVNLFWALGRMEERLNALEKREAESELLTLAMNIHEDDIKANQTMGELGANLIAQTENLPPAVLTHCNAGGLATGGYGTAIGVIRRCFDKGLISRVYAGETRPWMQGARLTAWELSQCKIPCFLLADSAASHLMKRGEIGWVIVGADRIAANGDVANKIGTYQLAIAARYHHIKFMVVAPTSTVDLTLKQGQEIPIEERSADEVLSLGGARVAAPGVSAINPVFDVTPAELIDAIVTEKGVVERPTERGMKALFN